MKQLDMRGKNCPIPLVETRKFIINNKDEDFKVILDNHISFLNIKKYLENNKINYSSNKSGQEFIFEIIFDGNQKDISAKFEIRNFSVLVMSNEFGVGDEIISKTLMKSYFYALTESITLPSNIIFINSGVKLLLEDSGILKSLEILKNKGINLLACGICIDFYDIKQQSTLSEITNMYSIIEILNNSDSIIRI